MQAIFRKIDFSINGHYWLILFGLPVIGPKVCTNIQAIYTLSICGTETQMKRLTALHENTRYVQALLYTHAKTHTDINWLTKMFEKDVARAMKNRGSRIQCTSHAMALALRKQGESVLSQKEECGVIRKLCKVIRSGNMTEAELVCCILALGMICDQRQQPCQQEEMIQNEVLEIIQHVEDYYAETDKARYRRAQKTAEKMIHGEALTDEEEEFLLTKIECAQ